MGKWVIDKQFSFCYGHRVWSQQLEEDYCESGDTSCKCRHLHGHEGLVHVFLEGEDLERGMVTDFKHLGWLKNFLDNTLDHKFIMDMNDPILGKLLNTPGIKTLEDGSLTLPIFCEDNPSEIFTELPLVSVKVPGTDYHTGYSLDVSSLKHGPEIEVYEGYFLVDWVPTSENFCKWLFDLTSYKMSLIDVDVAQVDWYETPKSRSSYRK